MLRNQRIYRPLRAVTTSFVGPVAPVAFDCIKFLVVRSGQARLLCEFGEVRIASGDVVVIAPNTLCGAIPESQFSATSLYLDRDYVLDQVFWQHADKFITRHDANVFLETEYPHALQILRCGDRMLQRLAGNLDELAQLSGEDIPAERFHRAQALLSLFLDEVAHHLATSDEQMSARLNSATSPTTPRHRYFRPLRAEARVAADLLREEIGRRWTIGELAVATHLSETQLRRVFVDAYGKTPAVFLTMLRVERMAFLLQNEDALIGSISAEVGWSDANFGALQFRRCIGISPQQFRRFCRQGSSPESAADRPCLPGETAISSFVDREA